MSQFRRRRAHGIALKLASVALFVVMQALVKATAPSVPPGEAGFRGRIGARDRVARHGEARA